MPATRDGKLWRSQFYYKDWQGVRRKKNKRGFKTKGEADIVMRIIVQKVWNLISKSMILCHHFYVVI